MPRFVHLLLCALLLIPACATPSLTARDQARMSGRVYVVTGASSGFGRGVALRLGASRANVVLAARRTDELEEVARQVRASGGRALVVTTDVSDAAQMERLAATAANVFGRIDVWINNAGVNAIGPFEAIPVVDHARVVDVNLKGVIYGSHFALRQFRRQGYGTLVNIASVEGKIPTPYHASYSATKHAVVGLGAALHQELRLSGARNIRIATVLPWAADTPLFDHSANYSGGTGRMILLDDPMKVVDAILWVSVHPRKELAVGWKAKGAVAGHQILPGLAQRITGDVMYDVQMRDAPPAPKTSGNLHRPVHDGKGVEGGVRARVREENRRLKEQRRGR